MGQNDTRTKNRMICWFRKVRMKVLVATAKIMKGEGMAEAEEVMEKFLGPEGEETLRKAKVLIASGYNVADKLRKALDALNELTESVAHSRVQMKEGYEQTKTFLGPGILQKLLPLYQKIKKFGIIGVLEDMLNRSQKQ